MTRLAEFVLQSSEMRSSLSLAWRDADRALATVRSDGLQAEADVYLPDGSHALAEQLRSSANAWRGWPGEMEWHSLEGELSVVWSHDGLGHVSFAVTLRRLRTDWATTAVITVEAGQLDRIATQAQNFLIPS